MQKTMVGLFDTFGETQNAVEDLLRYGVRREDISLVARDEYGDPSREREIGATAPAEGAGAGAVGGSLVGGALGLLVGAGLLVIPGIGPVLAAGPLAAAIGSATAAVGAAALGAGLGAAAGGLLGSLMGAGISAQDAQAYVEGVRRGGTLLSVGVLDHETDDVRQILVRNGAVDIESRAAEWRSAGWEADTPAGGPTRERSGARTYDQGAGRGDLDTALAGHPEAIPAQGDYARGQRHEAAAPVEPDYARGQDAASTDAHARSDRGDHPDTPHQGDYARGMREEEVDPLQPDYARGQRGYEEYDADFMAHYQSLTGIGGQPYDYYKPGYQFGYDLAGDPGYRHVSWSAAEGEARQRWEREARGSWDEFKQAIRYAWEKARG